MRHEYMTGGLYVLGIPLRSARFVKVLGAGLTSVWIRPFARPPILRWNLTIGVPTLTIEPEPNDELPGAWPTLIQVSKADLDASAPQFWARGSFSQGEREALDEALLGQVPVISPGLFGQLMGVEPSKDGDLEYRPCSVRLRDGTSVDRVYVVEAEPCLRHWGIWPELDRGKHDLPLEDVVQIQESPSRIPARLANKMYEAGESGVGYCRFVLVLRDGRRLPYVTGDAVDFVLLPPGVTPDAIADLLPHEGDGTLSKTSSSEAAISPLEGADYAWCLYRTGPGAKASAAGLRS